MSAAIPVRVRVETGTESSGGYEVRVGPGVLRDLGVSVRSAARPRRWAIITDHTVLRLYGEAAHASLEEEGLDCELVGFEPGEASKTRRTWARLCDRLLDLGFGRDTGIVALGGGVVGDLAGFVAATYLRGLPLVQVPTTLLAMVDAAVGGKTGIDLPSGKNLVGAFKWPALVVADPDVLRTLSDDVYRAGLAEAVKHAAIMDATHFSWLEAEAPALAAREPARLTELVRHSVGIKAAVVGEDPLETGKRAILNFGHTVAHALERASDYGMPHGFAVAVGMVVEARLGERLGVTEAGTAMDLTRVLSGFGLPVAVPREIPADRLVRHARVDKKNRRSEIRCALVARPGTPAGAATGEWTVAVSEADLLGAIADCVAQASTASGNSL